MEYEEKTQRWLSVKSSTKAYVRDDVEYFSLLYMQYLGHQEIQCGSHVHASPCRQAMICVDPPIFLMDKRIKQTIAHMPSQAACVDQSKVDNAQIQPVAPLHEIMEW